MDYLLLKLEDFCIVFWGGVLFVFDRFIIDDVIWFFWRELFLELLVDKRSKCKLCVYFGGWGFY